MNAAADTTRAVFGGSLLVCRCGHVEKDHLLGPGLIGLATGRCMAFVDRRHSTAGGPDLSECDCRGFVSIFEEPIR